MYRNIFGRACALAAVLLLSLIASGAALAVKPTFTSELTTTFTVGQPGTFDITATGDLPMRIYINGRKLPRGVTLTDHGDGTATLAGTPEAGTGGTYTFKINARNASGKTMKNFTLQVNQGPAFTSPNNLTCLVGGFCSLTVAASGNPAPSITRSGPALPTGMNYVDNGNGTGTLSGTPALATQGIYSFQFTAANGVPPDAVQNFTLTVNRFLNFTSTDTATCQVGVLCTFDITATGQPLPTISHSSGALPGGMTFVANGPGSATVSGTPQAGTGGVWHPVFTAHNGAEADAIQNFTLTVNEAPSIISANATSCGENLTCSFTVTTAGFPLPAIVRSALDALPSDLLYTDNGDGTGTIAGVPDPGTTGVYHFSFTASNGIGSNAVQNFTLSINLSLAITSADNTTCVVGSLCTFTVTTQGTAPIALSATGTVPFNVGFVDNGNGTATLSGTAVAGTGGAYPLVIKATNGLEAPFLQNFTLTMNEAPSITSANSKTCLVGSPCTFTVTAPGFPDPTITRTGAALPANLTFIDNADNTASLAGTPAVGTGGQYVWTITASNGVGTNATQSFTLTVNEAPSITSAPPPAGTTNAPYTFTYVALGYPAPTFTVSAGALPSPLSLSTGGVISGGTPSTTGLYTGIVTASNGIGADATQGFSIQITNASTVPTAPQNVYALSGNAQATVSFSPPASDGGALVTGYVATCTPGVGLPVTAAGGASPINVPGLTNGVTYTCTVHATNSNGDSPESAPSNPVTPSAGAPAALTVVVNGSGTGGVTSVPPGIDCPGDCTEIYPAGTGVILTATPTGGSVFMGWLGGGCGLAATCTVTINAATSVSATFAPAGTTGTLDVDASAPVSTYDALTDGLLVMRYLFGLSGAPLINNALGGTATRTTAAAIHTYLSDILPRLDADGNGVPDALTDGLLILRYQFGVTGPALISNAIGPGATRTTAAAIQTYLSSLQP